MAPSIELEAGLDFDLLDGKIHGSLEVHLATLDFPSFVIESPPTATLTVSPANPTVYPGTPVTFTSTSSGGGSNPVSWSLEGAATGDSITSGGVLTAVAPSGRSFTVVARDSTGATGKTTVTVGNPFDPVRDLSATQDSNRVNASVSWNAPEATGGSPIGHYTVTVSGGVATQITTGTSVSLTTLHPGTTYVVTVYATNTKGMTGPPASTSLEVIPLCTDTFTGLDSDAWATAANWSGGYVPGPGDWVCITGGNPVLSTSTTIEGLQLSGTLSIGTRDDLTVDNTADINDELNGPGTFTIPSGASAVFGNPSGGDQVVLTGGIDLVNKGTLTLPINDELLAEPSTFENAGTVDMGDSSSIINNGGEASITNDAGATISYTGTANAELAGAFADAGSLTASGGGTLDLQGAISLSTGATFTDGVEADGATLTPAGGSATVNLTNLALDDSDELNGPGTFTIPSGASAVFGNPSGGDQVVLTGGIDLVNKGTLTLPINDELLAEPSTFENAGTVDMGDSSSIINNGGEASITNDAGATISYTGTANAELRGSVRGCRLTDCVRWRDPRPPRRYLALDRCHLHGRRGSRRCHAHPCWWKRDGEPHQSCPRRLR